jgi:heptosyltransferase-2
MTVSCHAAAGETSPILVVPYMWVGDFVRCHSVVKLLKARWPRRPVDVLTTTRCAPLADYMPGLRQGIRWDLPRRRLDLFSQHKLARRLRAEGYGTVLVMPRTWKSALAPFLARIPERVGFVGEARFGLINDLRWGERRLARMVDRCAALALRRGAALPALPLPELVVPPHELADWLERNGLGQARPIVALSPGAVGPAKRWPSERYAELARLLTAQGVTVVVLGGSEETALARGIVREGGANVHDLTGSELRNAILALAVAKAAVSNDSGLLHVAAALGTPSIGIFGPTSPWHWAPLNPLAAVIETAAELPCRPCHQPVCAPGHHRCMREIATGQVLEATRRALAVVTGSRKVGG